MKGKSKNEENKRAAYIVDVEASFSYMAIEKFFYLCRGATDCRFRYGVFACGWYDCMLEIASKYNFRLFQPADSGVFGKILLRKNSVAIH